MRFVALLDQTAAKVSDVPSLPRPSDSDSQRPKVCLPGLRPGHVILAEDWLHMALITGLSLDFMEAGTAGSHTSPASAHQEGIT